MAAHASPSGPAIGAGQTASTQQVLERIQSPDHTHCLGASEACTVEIGCMRLPNPLHTALHAGSSAKAKVSSGPVSRMRESFPGPADTVR